jgi:DNA-binding PadR family transcriptional regulator
MQLSHILIVKAVSELNRKNAHPMDILRKYRGYGAVPKLSGASIYKILSRLEKDGYLASERIRGIPPRVVYRITERGGSVLKIVAAHEERKMVSNNPADHLRIARSDEVELSRFIEDEIAAVLFDYQTDDRQMRSIRKIARRVVDRMTKMIS